MNLTEQQQDALAELANIGASRAATQLSQLVNDTITIRMPEVIVSDLDRLSELLGNLDQEKTIVYQDMAGCLEGRAHLVYDLDECGSLIQLLLGALPAVEGVDLSAYEHEALTELANIVISTTIVTLGDSLNEEIRLSPPFYGRMSLMDGLADAQGTEKKQALILKTKLTASSRSVSGEVVLVLSLSSVQRITDMLDRILDVHSKPGTA